MKTQNEQPYGATTRATRATQLAETRFELEQLRGPNAQKFADSIGIGSQLFASYLETMETQERLRLRLLNGCEETEEFFKDITNAIQMARHEPS
jgi:hypothetical protein